MHSQMYQPASRACITSSSLVDFTFFACPINDSIGEIYFTYPLITQPTVRRQAIEPQLLCWLLPGLYLFNVWEGSSVGEFELQATNSNTLYTQV